MAAQNLNCPTWHTAVNSGIIVLTTSHTLSMAFVIMVVPDPTEFPIFAGHFSEFSQRFSLKTESLNLLEIVANLINSFHQRYQRYSQNIIFTMPRFSRQS